jgi:hypothetical protein
MIQDGIIKVLKSETSIEELKRVIDLVEETPEAPKASESPVPII